MTSGPSGDPAEELPVFGTQPLYRAQAVKALESSERLDELLPVTNLRTWWLAIAAALIVIAALVYAAVTPRNVTVSGEGRIVGDQGVALVSATAPGQLASFTLKDGAQVRVGDVIGYVVTADGRVPQRTQTGGTLLGYLVRPGDPISVGEWVAEVANKVDDGRTALMTVAPDEAAKLAEGQPVVVSVTGGPVVQGHVGPNRSTSLAPDRVQEGLGMLEPPPEPRVVVELLLDEKAPPGYEFTATVLVSERTLLGQLLGMS